MWSSGQFQTFFFYQHILHAQKARKAQKAQNAYKASKNKEGGFFMRIKNI